ncbi:MAG: tetratricopeptide repeat protein [Candidatus Omnitrophica bacterium]|nr:tetratricopeptide repeat protein [Candidatus Omnitrophota bacterium]
MMQFENNIRIKILIVISLLLLFSTSGYSRTINSREQEFLALLDTANTAFRKGEYNKAKKLSEDIISKVPNSAAYNILGVSIYMSENDPYTAIEYFKKSLELTPEQPDICKKIAIIYAELNDLDESIEYYKKAIQYDPDNKELLFTYGVLTLVERNDPYTALEYINKSRSNSVPNTPEALDPKKEYLVGICYLLTGKKFMVIDQITLLKKNNFNDMAEHLESMSQLVNSGKEIDMKKVLGMYNQK